MDSKNPVWGLMEDVFECSNDTCLEAVMATEVNKISGWQQDNVLLRFGLLKAEKLLISFEATLSARSSWKILFTEYCELKEHYRKKNLLCSTLLKKHFKFIFPTNGNFFHLYLH